MNTVSKIASLLGLACLTAQSLSAALIPSASTSSMKSYEEGPEKLTVYTDVPGHSVSMINGYASRAKSDIYEIWVRSAASNNQWVQCFANMTYNRGLEMPELSGFGTPTAKHAYQRFTAGWTHTYANFEMSDNSPVEVEIRKIGGTTLNGSSVIVKSAVHPAHKVIAGSKFDANGRVYFKIDKPCQVVIDINGQMDDHNAAFPVGTPGGRMADGSPVHGLALYANPIMAKPVASPTNIIRTVNPSESSPTTRLTAPDPSSYNTLAFAPGVHNIGPGFQVSPGKNYYIPGDAIVYGNISNDYASSVGYRSTGDRINIFGYGTLCGIQIPHHQNNVNNPEYPEWNAWTNRSGQGVGISINNSWDTKITGVTTIDPANFNTAFGTAGGTNNQNLVSWVKLHSWRVNGDGFGGYAPVEDSFFRTSDDSTYVRDWRRRCTFWKDTNANIFRFINYKSGGLDDCDVIYARWRYPEGVGSVFEFASKSTTAQVFDLDLVMRDIRFHDRFSNPFHLFSMELPESYRGLVFENISSYVPLNGHKSVLKGSAAAPWFERLVFKNITYKTSAQGPADTGTLLTAANFNNYFDTNEFVKYVLFDHPRNLTIAVTADPARGTVTKTPNQGTHLETTLVSLTATAAPGYAFTGWVGLNQEDPSTNPTDNPITIRMLDNRNITANFGLADISTPVVIATPRTGSWAVPAGVYSATIEAWGGGGAGGSAEHTPGLSTVSIRGGGGTGGSFSSRTLQVWPGQIINYTVGAGGVGSTLGAGQTFPADSNSGDGGGSSFTVDGQTAVFAIGGLGGKNMSGASSSASGLGRTAPSSGNTGDLSYYGGDGAAARSTGAGGGGGSAGSLGNGGDAPGGSPAGLAGPGGGAAGALGQSGNDAGRTGGFPGGGGSGAAVKNNGTGSSVMFIGGKGGDGSMTVTYNTMNVDFTLTTQATTGGTVTAGGTYDAGSLVSVSATEQTGYRFTGWSGGLTGTTNPSSFVLNNNTTVTANFVRLYSLTTSAVNGSVSLNPSGGTYDAGTVVTVTAQAAPGYVFTGWSGNLSGSVPSATVAMDSNKSVTANFIDVGGTVLSKTGWAASASASGGGEPAHYAFDGNINTRWSTGADQAPGQWFRLDMQSMQSFHKIMLDAGSSSLDYPRGYEVHVSNDGSNWGSPVATGAGSSAVTVISFPQQTARYIKVTQTGSAVGRWWSIHEFHVLNGLSAPWQTADIGAVGVAGSAVCNTAVWTIEGSGADIWNSSDEFRYVYQGASGDCSVVARVASLTSTNAWAKSGVMIRESTAANSIHAMVCVTPSNGISFQWRSATGGTCGWATVTGQTAPKWVKLTRTGASFAASFSADKTTWTPIGTAQTITMANAVTMGLAVTSHNDGILCRSTVDDVTATP
jgi:uncharacterized repeat protein (TIGR02543 family)